MSDDEARDLEGFLYELRDMVENARTMPMSASVLVNRDDAIALVDDILRSFPEELRQARWLLREKDQFLGQARHEADDIIEAARVQAERMVERTEIAREARRTAQRIVDDAQMQARQLVHEAEDYIDQKLASFETVLERTLQTVQKGRTRLQVAVEPLVPEGEVAGAEGRGGEFFDQDGG
jgi:F0F1-type ATP synthase membrane subunit b/b'